MKKPHNTIVIRISDNNKTIHVQRLDPLRIELSGNATTGFMWRTVKVSGHSVVASPTDWQYTMSPTTPGALYGSGGLFVLHLKPVSEGTTEFFLTYDQPFNPSPGYSFHVTIKVDATEQHCNK